MSLDLWKMLEDNFLGKCLVEGRSLALCVLKKASFMGSL